MKDARTREQEVDEILETLWSLNELRRYGVKELRRSIHLNSMDRNLRRMARDRLVERTGDSLKLTAGGEKRARLIIRRHRLAERLLTDLLELDEREVESTACQFEHILSPGVTDSVCTLLGHPPLCPHGKPIPRGACCARPTRELEPVVRRLTDMDPGEQGKILFISPKSHTGLDRLMSMGISAGSQVRLHQRQPSFVIRLGETVLALDTEVATGIFVRVEK